MFPKEFDDFEQFRQQYGPVDKLDTRIFLTGMFFAFFKIFFLNETFLLDHLLIVASFFMYFAR